MATNLREGLRESRARLRRATDEIEPRTGQARAMYARAIDDAGTRLRELRRDEWHDLGLAGVALALAIGATEYAPSLALPLLVGAFTVGALGVRALWRHWDLVDRLADEGDAYTIDEVLAYASRETTMDRRRRFAELIRHHLALTGSRLHDAADELAALADELDDEALELSPACAVACARLVSDPVDSPLLNPALPQHGLRSRASRIRSGFTRRPTP